MNSFFDKQLKRRNHPGLESLNWGSTLKYTLFVYLVLTCFACYYRADFLSLTAIAIGIYIVQLPQMSKRSVFRALVAYIAFSFVYDFIHLVFLHDSDEDDEADGGIQSSVRMFSYFFAWVSFLIRPFVFLIFWKVSLNYMKVIKNTEKEETAAMAIWEKFESEEISI